MGLQLLDSVSLSSDASTVEFSGISQVYGSLVVRGVWATTSNVNPYTGAKYTFNNVTNSYSNEGFYIIGSLPNYGTYAIGGTGQSYAFNSGYNLSGDTDRWTCFKYAIYDYANTSYFKNAYIEEGNFAGLNIYSAGYQYLAQMTSQLQTTSAITSVQFACVAGNIKSGSRFYLYGLEE